MAIVGFNLEKISVEKKAPVKGVNIDVKNNVTIKEIAQKELSYGDEKRDGLKFAFEYAAVYSPDIGNITIHGNVLYLASNKKSKEILKMWEKEQKLTKEIAPEILNTILMRCSIKTLNLAQEVNLPPNISLPALKVKNPEDIGNYIG